MDARKDSAMSGHPCYSRALNIYRNARMDWAAHDEAESSVCPNGPDRETGDWPCDPQEYFGVLECQVCGRVGSYPDKHRELGEDAA